MFLILFYSVFLGSFAFSHFLLHQAYAGARFTGRLLEAIKGKKDVIECSFIENTLTAAPFFSTPVSVELYVYLTHQITSFDFAFSPSLPLYLYGPFPTREGICQLSNFRHSIVSQSLYALLLLSISLSISLSIILSMSITHTLSLSRISYQVLLGPSGVEKILPFGTLSAMEQATLDTMLPDLCAQAKKGVDYVKSVY